MTRVIVRDLAAGTPYFLQVREVNQDTQSDWSYRIGVTTNNDTSLPKAPTALAWSSAGRSFIGTWTAPTQTTTDEPLYNFDKYQVRITHEASSQNVVYDTKSTRFDFTYEMNEAKFGSAKSPLNFEVRAVTTAGNASAWAGPTTGTNPVPGSATLATPIALVESIALNWTLPADLDLTGSNIYASQSDGFTPGVGNLIKNTGATSYVFNTTSGSAWYFHVRPVDIFGQEGTSTQSSGVVAKTAMLIDTTAPAAPSAVGATSSFDPVRGVSTMTVSWTLSTDDTGGSQDVQNYYVRYSADGGTNYDYAITSDGVTTVRFDVVPGSTYTIGVAAQDFQGNRSSYTPTSPTTTSAPIDTLTATPSAPTAVGNTLQVQVSHDNLDNGAVAMPANVTGYEVYASKTTGFTTYDSTTLIGKILKSNVTSGTFYLPVTTISGTAAEPWYVKVRAIGRAPSVVSPVSAQTTVTPGLIGSANIVDASITNAKIVNLVADKITAGSGIIANLTIGNATQAGYIASYDYVAGTTGYKIGGTSGGVNILEINSGLVKAAALELRNSPNIIHQLYADFEARPSAYTFGSQNTTVTIDGTVSRINSQSLKGVTTSSSNRIFLGTSTTDYNTSVEEGKTYIFSYYSKVAAAPNNTRSYVKYVDSAGTPVGSEILLENTANATTDWIRHSATLTIPATAVKALFSIGSSVNGLTYNFDSIQLEEKVGFLSTPNSWAPPSYTTIIGGQIKTGSIQSNQDITVNSVVVPRWFINVDGAAQFSDAKILGTLIVGGANIAGTGTDTSSASLIKSQNYDPNVAGWKIDAAGNAELNSAIIRGQLSTGTIVGDLIMAGGTIKTATTGDRAEFAGTGIKLYNQGLSVLRAAKSINNAYYVTCLDYGAYIVADGFSSRIARHTEGDGLLWSIPGPGQENNGLATQFGTPNYLYVTDTVDALVRKFDADTGIFVTSWASPSAASIAATPGGLIYTIDYAGKLVRKTNNTGGSASSWSTVGNPTDICVDSTGAVYVLDTTNNLIRKFSSTGTAITTWSVPSGGTGLYSNWLAGTDYIYLQNVVPFTSTYTIYSTTGTILTAATSDPTTHRGFCVEPSGHILALKGDYTTDHTSLYEYSTPSATTLITDMQTSTGKIITTDAVVKGSLFVDRITGNTANLDLEGVGQWEGMWQPILWRAQSSGTNMIDGSVTLVSGFGTTTLDLGGAWAYSNGSFTCKVPGVYLVIGEIAWTGTAGGIRRAYLFNGASSFAEAGTNSTSSASTMYQQVVGFQSFAEGDVLQMKGFQNSGGNFSTGVTNTQMQIFRIGGTSMSA